ncbi:MAG: acetate/propionate family kinase [Anaerorhabdus sp.]
MNKIMVVNCGSSSIKFQILMMPSGNVLCSGIVEKIGLEVGYFKLKYQDKKIEKDFDCPTHKEGLAFVCKELIDEKVLHDLSEIKGCGHRVTHGGEAFKGSVIIDDKAIKQIEEYSDLAPLHNPVNALGYHVMKEMLPTDLHVAVFDTSFHQTIDEDVYLYPIPHDYYEDYRIRKYGFHGTSHRYVYNEAEKKYGKEAVKKTIVCHLGNGASVCAIEDGKSVDTSMGFTPLGGLMMGTRCGNIDPAIVDFLCDKENKSADEVLYTLNHKSGMLGLSEVSSDMRELTEAANGGNKKAKTAMNVYARRVADYIGAYTMKLRGLDTLIFTAGIGENSGIARHNILENIKDALQIKYDNDLNMATVGTYQEISSSDSKVRVLVIPTNEELMIAKEVQSFLDKK